jgi:hypothetical protein
MQRQLTAEEVDELHVFDLPELQGKRWFYVELSTAGRQTLWRQDLEQGAKQYVMAYYQLKHFKEIQPCVPASSLFVTHFVHEG